MSFKRKKKQKRFKKLDNEDRKIDEEREKALK